MSNFNHIQSYIEVISSSRMLLNQIVATVRQQDTNLNSMISSDLRHYNRTQAQNQHSNINENNDVNTPHDFPDVPENLITPEQRDLMVQEQLYPQSFRDHVQRIRTAQHARPVSHSPVSHGPVSHGPVSHGPVSRLSPRHSSHSTSSELPIRRQPTAGFSRIVPPPPPTRNINAC